jgi:hypothetical protein
LIDVGLDELPVKVGVVRVIVLLVVVAGSRPSNTTAKAALELNVAIGLPDEPAAAKAMSAKPDEDHLTALLTSCLNPVGAVQVPTLELLSATSARTNSSPGTEALIAGAWIVLLPPNIDET